MKVRLPLPRTHERPCLCLPLPMRQRCDSYCSGRKRKALGSSLPIRRSSRLSSEQSAPGSGKGAQPELDTQSDQIIGQPPPPSPLAASQRPYRILYSFQEPREIFMVPVLVLLARCTFCRHLPLFCSFKLLANIILPLGRTTGPDHFLRLGD